MGAILFVADLDAREHRRWLDELRAALPEERWLDARAGRDAGTDDARIDVAGIDIAVVANPPAGALAGLPHLKLVQSLWAGVERLLADTSLPAHVPLARMVDPAMNAAMAETALWAVLALHRGFFAYARRQLDREWRAHAQRRADEVAVAVLGLGQMGGTVARRLAANGYRVHGWSTRPATVEGVHAHHGADALQQLLASCEIVLNVLPLTDATRGLFDAATFSRMRAGANFVNLARGAHVVEPDLLAALDDGRLRHAVLDVFATEPLPREHRFWTHPRVTVLPHAAAQTDPRSASQVVARNVRALRAGRAVEHLVDCARGY